MTFEEWASGLAPKVDGTWNLHHAVQHCKLDFFVAFSSIVGTCGHIGQANYAAANTFLEAFTQYRRQLGLPSSVLSLGVVEEVGLVSRDPKILQNARLASVHLLQEKDVIEGLQVAIRDSPVAPGGSPSSAGSCTWAVGLGHTKPLASIQPMWMPDARFTLYPNLESAKGAKSQAQDDEFRNLLDQIEQNPSILDDNDASLAVAQQLCKLLARQLFPGQESMSEQSSQLVVDSLMSIEIRNWSRRMLGVEVSLAEINKAGTVGGLVTLTLCNLKEKYQHQEPRS